MHQSWRHQAALAALQQGELIAYPTEAVWGLGCDPWSRDAVEQLLALKHRSVDKADFGSGRLQPARRFS